MCRSNAGRIGHAIAWLQGDVSANRVVAEGCNDDALRVDGMDPPCFVSQTVADLENDEA